MANARRTANGKTLLKVILLGDGGVGKSCLMNRFISNKFDTQCFHTIGVEFLNKDIRVDGKLITLQIWDTAGQERFKSLRTPFYRGADCCLLTFSLTDVASFKNIQMWRTEFIHYADVPDPEHFPFIVLGNKVDLNDKRQVSHEEAAAWCRHHNMPYFETSAKDAVNVDVAFEQAVKRTIELEQYLENVQTKSPTDTVDLKSKSNKGGCC